ncbi:hypothetical protein ACWA2C_15940 [Priestia megaterium]
MMIKPSPSVNFYQYPNIYIERETAIGKRLVIVAEADKGDFYDPTLIYTKDMAADFFGGGQLVQAYEDATTFQEGLSIYLMRIEPMMYEDAFSVLEALTFDLLYIDGVHYDKHKEIILMFIELAKIKEEKGNLIHGITTLSSAYKTYTSLIKLRKSIAELAIDSGDDFIERGKYLSIVVDQAEFKNAGAVYAGMLAYLDPEVSPVNKTIPNINLTVEYTKDQILDLRSIGIVCFKNTFKKGVTCTSSSCAVSTDGSVHKHISNFRIAQSLINQVALELQPLIGKTNILYQTLNAEDILNGVCDEFVSLSRIRDYNYNIVPDTLNGAIDVEIEFVPVFSVHSMSTHTRVRVFK